ncbi:MAG: hypothetical protein IT373_27690 [Polyangiaceae bacterium]|nr:hypothetical protein [Polyangiaceae bacterium]
MSNHLAWDCQARARSTRRVAAALALALGLPACTGDDTGSSGVGANGAGGSGANGASGGAGGSGGEPYRWYPALDLATVPFHATSPVRAPDPPATTTTVHVSDAPGLVAAALVPGTEVVVDADIAGPIIVFGEVVDVDIVVPVGVTLGQLILGVISPPSRVERVRVRGSTPGTHSGGVVGLIMTPDGGDHIILDGIDLNGGTPDGLLYQLGTSGRVAIVNVRGHAAGAGSLGRASDLVVAGSTFRTSVRARSVNGFSEGWGLRHVPDRFVLYQSRIDGTRYHRVRLHPEPGATQYAYVAENTFVDPYEARILWGADVAGNGARLAGMWAHQNQIYAHTTCFTPSFEAADADLADLTGNVFHGSFTATLQQAVQDAHGPGHDYVTGNVFEAWQAPPAWPAPGDPGQIPLPPVDAQACNPALDTPVCAGPPELACTTDFECEAGMACVDDGTTSTCGPEPC